MTNAPAPAALAGLLACPRCDRSLTVNADGTSRCPACSVTYPLLAGIPCLQPEPGAALAEWRTRWQFAIERLLGEAMAGEAALKDGRLRSLGRERLEHVSGARRDQARRLREVLAPLAVATATPGLATHLALRTRLPPDQGLTTYAANIHRDWCWGDEENALCHQLVAPGLPADARSVLVLGAGAGRLAYDLHQASAAVLTVALDFNPLLTLLCRQLAAGESVQLWEFPLAPRSLTEHAVLRTLAAPAPARPGFEVVLGDALRPPFVAEGFDAVVTPWVVDILPEDFRVLAARINGLLAPGGRWLCFGSLNFSGADPVLDYSLEEALAVVMDSGFASPDVGEHDIPYLCSPASRHARRESVVTLAATKTSAVPRPARHRALPDWLVEGTQPVPLLPAFQVQAMSTRIYAFLMGLIDGRRSLKDMARLLVEQRLMAREDAEPAVRNFLVRMYDDSRRPPGL